MQLRDLERVEGAAVGRAEGDHHAQWARQRSLLVDRSRQYGRIHGAVGVDRYRDDGVGRESDDARRLGDREVGELRRNDSESRDTRVCNTSGSGIPGDQ